MISTKYLKQVVQPRDLALRTLGAPVHKKGESLWYKSPFRAEERTASFEVTARGFHDFGTDEHFDVIEYAKRYYSCSFKEAMNKLATLYGLTENEYETESMRRYLEQQRLAMKAYVDKVENWFRYFINFVEFAWDDNEALIKAMQKDFETLPMLYDRQVFLGCLREEILDTDTFEKKERLRNQITKEGLPVWMKNLEIYFSTHMT